MELVCLLEPHLDSNTAPDDGNLVSSVYNLKWFDHSSNTKHGSVCICYKQFLHWRVFSFDVNIIENATSPFGLQQVIKEPTHILNNSSSCIDLTFTSQANLLIESGVKTPLHSNYDHIVYSEFVLNIFYPPRYLIAWGMALWWKSGPCLMFYQNVWLRKSFSKH